jgi:RNA polymerase sigma factor (sigma-70 family)
MENSANITKVGVSRQKIIETVKAYGKRLFAFIRAKVKSDEDAEDILQDVWFQLSHSVEPDEIEQMSGWLFHVARNKIIDKHRKKTTASLDDYIYENEDGEFCLRDILLTDGNNPETEYLKEVFWQELLAALEELPVNQREVFIWNELEDMTLQEIADQTGEKLKTIISRKGYAVKHLREKLESLYLELLNY